MANDKTIMTKDQLFERYSINDDSLKDWYNLTDPWAAVEVYRLMHNDKIPPEGQSPSPLYVLEFLDKMKDPSKTFSQNVRMKHPHWGAIYITAKRMVYKYADQILKELNA